MAQSKTAYACWDTHKTQHLQALTSAGQIALPNTHRPRHLGAVGTGKAFGHELVRLITNGEDESAGVDLRVVSCDLATSCGINGIVGHSGKFYELGVAEQDAASFSAGMALESNGKIVPVFCTYSNFLKRCYEQMFINAVQGAPHDLRGDVQRFVLPHRRKEPPEF